MMVSMAVSAQADTHTRVTNPSAVSLELLGRGFFYSLNFDRVISDDIAVGAGFGTASTDNGSISMIPVYGNYYFKRDANSLFATAGVAIIPSATNGNSLRLSTARLNYSTPSVAPELGLGFESRGDAGFLFRGTAYVIITDGKVFPWGGVSFGYAF